MNPKLWARIQYAIRHPEEPFLVTPDEAAILDAYVALVEAFEISENEGRFNA